MLESTSDRKRFGTSQCDKATLIDKLSFLARLHLEAVRQKSAVLSTEIFAGMARFPPLLPGRFFQAWSKDAAT